MTIAFIAMTTLCAYLSVRVWYLQHARRYLLCYVVHLLWQDDVRSAHAANLAGFLRRYESLHGQALTRKLFRAIERVLSDMFLLKGHRPLEAAQAVVESVRTRAGDA